MADDVLMVLDIDTEPAMAALDALDTALSALGDEVASVGADSEGMVGLEDILSAIEAETATVAEGFATLSESIASVGAASAEASAGLEEMAGAEEGAAAAGAGIEASLGPLVMLAGAAVMASKAFADMGMAGEQGESQLRAMADVGQGTINELQNQAMRLGVSMTEASQGFYQVSSAGFTAAKGGMKVFEDATELSIGTQSQAGDTMSALTTIMNQYGAQAGDAGTYTDDMMEAIKLGRQNMQQFSASIDTASAAGSVAGYTFKSVAAAEAVMSESSKHLRTDTQHLAKMFEQLDASKIAAEAKKAGLSFDAAHFKSLNLAQQLQYLAKVAGGTSPDALKKLLHSADAASAASFFLRGHIGMLSDNLKAMASDTGKAHAAFEDYSHTVPGALAKVSAAFSVLATKFMDAIGPSVIPIIEQFGNMVSQMASGIASHMDVVIPIVVALATVIGVILVAAVVAMIAATWPILLVLAAVGAAVGIVIAVIMHWGSIMNWFRNLWNSIWNSIMSFFSALPGRAMSIGQSFISGLTSVIVGGLNNLAGLVSNAVSGIAGKIASLLHFSKPEEGPLADVDQWMPHFGDLLVSGLNQQHAKLKAATTELAGSMALSMPTNINVTGGGAPAMGGVSGLPLFAAMLAQLQQLNRKPTGPEAPPTTTMYTTASIYGVQNVMDLYRSLNTAGGYEFEGGMRGLY